MKHARRMALVVFMLALAALIATGFYRAMRHEEARPATAPAGSASTTQPG